MAQLELFEAKNLGSFAGSLICCAASQGTKANNCNVESLHDYLIVLLGISRGRRNRKDLLSMIFW
jgi:hypothetical protein